MTKSSGRSRMEIPRNCGGVCGRCRKAFSIGHTLSKINFGFVRNVMKRPGCAMNREVRRRQARGPRRRQASEFPTRNAECEGILLCNNGFSGRLPLRGEDCRLRWVCLALTAVAMMTRPGCAQGFTIEQALSAPFANELRAAPAKGRLAWVANIGGRRNLWVADPGSGGA